LLGRAMSGSTIHGEPWQWRPECGCRASPGAPE
jgi:hypothetical protein